MNKRILMVMAGVAGLVAGSAPADWLWWGAGGLPDTDWSNTNNWRSTVTGRNLTEPRAGDSLGIGVANDVVHTAVVSRAGEVCSGINLGYDQPRSAGELRVNGGSLNVSGSTYVGFNTLGRMRIAGGTATLGNLCIGHDSASTGWVEVDGGILDPTGLSIAESGTGTLVFASGQLLVSSINVGIYNGSRGEFVQTGGASTNSGMNIGGVNGGAVSGVGTVTLKGGEMLSTGQVKVGYYGRGTYRQTGGTNTFKGFCYVGENVYGHLVVSNGLLIATNTYAGQIKTASGLIEICGGTYVPDYMQIGVSGTGTVRIAGGHFAPSGGLLLGANATSRGEIEHTGEGAFTLAGGRTLQLGNAAPGILTIGTVSPGAVIGEAAASAHLTVRSGSTGTGVVRGRGTLALTGNLKNNGVVVADGFGADHTLDLKSMTLAGNDWANTSTNGWYACNRGKLLLKPFSGSNGTRYWGDVNNDDLVNSVKLVLAGGTGSVTGALLAADHGDVPPGLTHPAGVWNFGGFACSSATLTFHYDALALAPGVLESRLKVYRHIGGAWQVCSSPAGLDEASDRITASLSGSVELGTFAVAPLPDATLMIIR